MTVITDTTTKFPEQNYGKKIPDVEAMEYKTKLTQFFSLLVEIDQKNKKKLTINSRGNKS